jgi:asparagine synthase (glutamine-hydrolysing)
MCGIAGIVGLNPSPKILKAMGNAMIHRGPDDEGMFLGPDVGLVFRRLAIVDLAGGKQPMANEDGRVQLVFNGEIYDHHQLRKELVAQGHRFVTDHSDTEVLVHGWEEWGYELFPRLNGMFAVAIWDQDRQTLVLARDRYGIKPLYFATIAGGAMLFGSEVRALLASRLIDAQPNPAGILEYFSFQNLWQDATMFRDIVQLEPGTVLTWKRGRLSRRRYWDIEFPRSRRASMPELVEEHRAIVTRAVRRQIAADVPVKTYLSGGIDSTAITVIAHKMDPTVTAYSCIFNLDNVGQDRIFDEREFSRLVAREYGLQRVELELDQDSLQHCMAHYVESLEDLRMGMGYPVYLIAQRVAQDAKVVLSGTGGDEFHAGYVGRYQVLGLDKKPARAQTSWRGTLKRWLRRALGRQAAPQGFDLTQPEGIYRNVLNSVIKTHELAQTFTPEFLRSAAGFDAQAVIGDFLRRCPSKDWRNRVLYVDAKTYLAGLLAFEDKVSMAHSLETRVPLLDNELVDFVLDIPFDALWQGPVGKVIFRESVKPWVPEQIFSKPKMGFGPPDGSWYRGVLRPWIEQTLSPQTVAARGIFQPAFVQAVLDDHFAGRRETTWLIWSLLNFELWCQAFGMFGAQPARTRYREVA